MDCCYALSSRCRSNSGRSSHEMEPCLPLALPPPAAGALLFAATTFNEGVNWLVQDTGTH